jgi:hypothetical protein
MTTQHNTTHTLGDIEWYPGIILYQDKRKEDKINDKVKYEINVNVRSKDILH